MNSSAARKRAWRRRFNRLFGQMADGKNGSLLELLNLYRPYLLATARARLEQRLKALEDLRIAHRYIEMLAGGGRGS